MERGELRPGPALQQEHPPGGHVVDDDGGDKQGVGVECRGQAVPVILPIVSPGMGVPHPLL